MITTLRCYNYKCFSDTKEIALAPLTILVGENNSGKTSLIEALQLLALTARSPDPGVSLKFMDTDYDFGTFVDVVADHDSGKTLRLSFGFSIPQRRLGAVEVTEGSSMARLDVHYSYLPNRKEVHLARLDLHDADGLRLSVEAEKYSGRLAAVLRGWPASAGKLTQAAFVRRGFLFYPVYGFFYQAARTKQVRSDKLQGDVFATQQMLEAIARSFRRTYHLGPLRSPPQRAYAFTGERAEWVGARGEAAVQIFSSLTTSGRAQDSKTVLAIRDALTRLGFVQGVELRPSGPRWYEFWTTHPKSHRTASVADSGFGASQVFPVVVSLLTAKPDTTLLYEQPELHLHPAAQAELGSVFANAVSEDRRVVVETHSENLILRLQRDVALGKLRAEDVLFYYVSAGKTHHAVKRLTLDGDGKFREPWPKGFFEEGYREALGLVKARQARRGQ